MATTLFPPTPLLDLGNLLSDIAAQPERYWWLYFGFFSTLVPTFLHFGVSAACLISWIPGRAWIAQAIEDPDDGGRNFRGQLALSLVGTALFAIPLFTAYLLALAIYTWHPEIGLRYLWFFSWFANLLGEGIEKSDIIICASCV